MYCLVCTVLKHLVGPFELSFIYLVDFIDKGFLWMHCNGDD